MRVEGVLANISSEDVRCEATHTFQELSTTDTTIELDVVDVSSVNVVLEETFGEEVSPEKIRPVEVCCEAPETQVMDMALWMENSFGANGCRDIEDEFSLSVSPRNFPSKEDRDPPPPKQNLIGRRTE